MAPAWATDELAEEWVEPSTSPTHEPPASARALFGSLKGGGNSASTNGNGNGNANVNVNVNGYGTGNARKSFGSMADKRGSMRSLGHSAPRGMPSFQPPEVNSADTSDARIFSGHQSGQLVPSGEFIVPSGTGLLSPPSSRSSSEGNPAEMDNGERDAPVGTCVVNENAADDRGERLAKGVAKGKDFFGKNPLERMFEPPSPPTSGSEQLPPTPSPMPSTFKRQDSTEPRRASHAYAPARPSRLSKSVTPSSNGSTVVSEFSQGDIEPQGGQAEEGDQSLAPTVPEQDDTEFAESVAEPEEQQTAEMSMGDAVSPLARGATRFPFTFKAPVRAASGETGSGSGTGTGSGSATIRGGTVRSNIFDSMEERDDGPNHSTIHEKKSPVRFAVASLASAMESGVEQEGKDRIRLFRSTYDTFTREHLSAIVDAIAVEPSPSPPQGTPVQTWSQSHHSGSPAESNMTEEGSDDSRNSKRLRLSPPSPPWEPRDWGKHGMEILGRIKGRAGESTTSASASPMSRDQNQSAESPYGKYDTVQTEVQAGPSRTRQPPAEPVERQTSNGNPNSKHRSNPSTASSGYLRAAEEIMANLRNRAVSESASASALESSPGTLERKAYSETEDNVGSSETGDERLGPQYNSARHVSVGSFRSSPESVGSYPTNSFARSAGSLRRSGQQNLALSLHHNAGPNTDDLNRFVSSTTIPTSTTISTSFVKHAGPRGKGKGMTMIRPEEVNGLVASQVGKMRYDPDLMRWVRDGIGALGKVSEGSESRLQGSDESVDVFAGMSDGSRPSAPGSMRNGQTAAMAMAMETDRYDDQHQDDSSSEDEAVQAANTTTIEGAWSDGDQSTSSDDMDERVAPSSDAMGTTNNNSNSNPANLPVDSPSPIAQAASEPIDRPTSPINPLAMSIRPQPRHANSAPAIMTPLPSHLAPRPIRSALRNGNGNGGVGAGGAAGPSETPGVKKTTGWAIDLTPLPAGIRSATRSVSFSDGKRPGQMDGMDIVGTSARKVLFGAGSAQSATRGGGDIGEDRGKGKRELMGPGGSGSRGNLFDMSGQSLMNSARTRRIQGLLEDMEELSLHEMTPSKPSRNPESARPPLAPTPGPNDTDADTDGGAAEADATVVAGFGKRGFRRSRSFRDREDQGPAKSNGNGNATFLTECSFAVANDHLVKVITDVQPFEPYWDTLESVTLSGKGLESVARLKEFLPGLDEVKLDDNAISYLTGIPAGVRTLHVAGNRLTALASVDHLRNLQFLDISRNQLDSVTQLSCLHHLRELRADNNRISNLDGILGLNSLLKLSVTANRIDTLDLREAKWAKLETLDIAQNGLGETKGLETLASLAHLNIDDNDITALSSSTPLKALRSLRISRNDLSYLDLSCFPKIRILYADQNRLSRLHRTKGERSRLEALSLRSQRVRGVRVEAKEVADLKRLYLSGNELQPDSIPSMGQLRYLEVAACRFSSWPDLSRIPNLEVLNANYNFFETLEGLRGASNLRKVMLVGNRLCEGSGATAKSLRGLKVEELDLRMNPSTLGFYLPLFIPPPPMAVPTGPKAQTHPNKTAIVIGRPNGTLSASRMSAALGQQSIFHQPENTDWQLMDREFRKNLPDTWYGKRLVYRGLIMRGCERLIKLDGVDIGDAEKRKAGALLDRTGR